jgi:tRNA(fMet)-specific endonuclease VapC
MGVLIDSTVFIALERRQRRQPALEVMEALQWQLTRIVGPDVESGMAPITATELLHGVHRADDKHRLRREAFVDAALDAFPTIPIDLRTARVHAQLWAQLAAAGKDIGPHDRWIAATALVHGWALVTANVRHFRQVPGLDLVELSLD